MDTINHNISEGKEIDSEEIIDELESILLSSDPSLTFFARIDPNIRLFTGEKLSTILAAKNILRIEAAKAMHQIKGTLEDYPGYISWHESSCFLRDYCIIGECAHSFIASLRLLNSMGQDNQVRKHLEIIRGQRDDKGRWKKFPFYYTLLALSEIDHKLAREEIIYALPAVERFMQKKHKHTIYNTRKMMLLDTIAANSSDIDDWF